MRLPRFARNDKRKGARNDSGVEKVLAMTREVSAPVKNTGKAGYNRLDKLWVVILQPVCYRFTQRFCQGNHLAHFLF